MKSIYKTPEGEKEIKAMYDYILQRWPVTYEELVIPTCHGDTSVIASGNTGSPALILLHGSCSNAVSWIGEIKEYSRHFRVFAVDILGEAGKSSTNRPGWDTPAFAEWLEEVLNALKIEKASFLGLSLGGWMALKFATWRPERVEKLVLLAPGGVVPAKASFLFAAIAFGVFGKLGSGALNRMVFKGHPGQEGAERFLSVIMKNFKPRIDRQPMFTDEQLKKLTMPVLLIAGALDAVLPSEKIVARMKRLLPGLDATLLPDAGHALTGMAALTVPFLTLETARQIICP